MDMLGPDSLNREVVLSLKSECLGPQTVSFMKRFSLFVLYLERHAEAKMCYLHSLYAIMRRHGLRAKNNENAHQQIS